MNKEAVADTLENVLDVWLRSDFWGLCRVDDSAIRVKHGVGEDRKVFLIEVREIQ